MIACVCGCGCALSCMCHQNMTSLSKTRSHIHIWISTMKWCINFADIRRLVGRHPKQSYHDHDIHFSILLNSIVIIGNIFDMCVSLFFFAFAEDWVKIDIGWRIMNWIKYNDLYHVIGITCNTCEKHPSLDLFSLDNDYKPFIVVNTHPSRKIKRQRRSINCSPGVTECCREKLYISFEEIGWNDWILHPPGYDAYFCRGSCETAAAITLSGSHYNSVLMVRIAFAALFVHSELVPTAWQNGRTAPLTNIDFATDCFEYS